MTKYNTIPILLVAILCAASPVCADTVILKNGGSVLGIIGKEDDNSVEVNIGFGTITFKKAEIKYIERSSAEDSLKMSLVWESKRRELKSKEQEFEEARDRRFKIAYENKLEDERAKKAGEGREGKQIDIKRDHDGKSIVVEALLNDSVKVNLILDTGASIVALSRKAGIELGMDLSDTKKDIVEMRLADGRKSMAKTIVLDSVKVQDVEVKNVMAAVMLDQVPAIGMTDGLLGMSFLSKFNLKTDFKSMKMTLEKIE